MKTIPLTRGQSAIIDDADFERVGNLKWFAIPHRNGFYAARHTRLGRVNTTFLHRVIMGDPVGKEVDHENHNTLDCRRSNLRVCTVRENGRNRTGAMRNSKSGIRGVSWCKVTQKWHAQICLNGKQTSLGKFFSKEDAAEAYASANKKHFAEFGGGLTR